MDSTKWLRLPYIFFADLEQFWEQFWSSFEQYSVLGICPRNPKQQRRSKKTAKLRIPRQFWFLPLEEPAYKSKNAQFGLVMLNYKGFATPSVLLWDIHFWLTDRKNCLKAPSLPVYTNFDRKHARRKNPIFWWSFWSKNAIFWAKFFGKKKCAKRRKIFGQIRFLIVMCEGSDNHFDRPNKNTDQNYLFS